MAATGAGAPHPLRRMIEAHLGSRQVSRVIYGSIIGLALLLVLEAHDAAAGVAIGSLTATALAVALAEAFSEVIGTETRTRRRVGRADLRHIAVDVVAVAFGVAFPSVFLLLAAVGLIGLDAAFAVAKWTGLGLIGAYGFLAARFSGAGLAAALMRAAVVVLAGVLLIVVKAVLH